MSVIEKLNALKKYFVEEYIIKPNRRVYVFKSEDLKALFQDLIKVFGYENFYVATIVGTDLISEGKIRLDYYVNLLPDEVTVVFRTYLPRENPTIDSLIDIIPGVLSGECETYDLVGVVFRGNEFLKRGFFVPKEFVEQKIYPLRKDVKV
ncbi:MAG: NADH-quinone oxidoreductase subunit D [Desulfurococcales archaeon ex4484_58]|nr:MAG: NADH-quinone oxidoreductase subunit D [Desulfurococcales archaeon ex4484_58]